MPGRSTVRTSAQQMKPKSISAAKSACTRLTPQRITPSRSASNSQL